MSKIRVSVIGYGYWGPNHCRVVQHHKGAELRMICDQDPERLRVAREYYPEAACTNDVTRVFEDAETDAVIIATPASTHAGLIKMALRHGKHILCEKPLTRTTAEIDDLEADWQASGKILMCAHIFVYNPVVRYIKNYLDTHDIGKFLYLIASRNGLGPVRKDINVLYDLATHDISILLFLLDKFPRAVSAFGASHFNNPMEDNAIAILEFDDHLLANIQVSWLDPIKERNVKIVGSKKMLLFNDISPDEKLKIVSTGESYLNFDGDFGLFQSTIKDGDILIPNILYTEPLAGQFAHFTDCIRNGQQPATGLHNARQVVRILEALNQSIKQHGARIEL